MTSWLEEESLKTQEEAEELSSWVKETRKAREEAKEMSSRVKDALEAHKEAQKQRIQNQKDLEEMRILVAKAAATLDLLIFAVARNPTLRNEKDSVLN